MKELLSNYALISGICAWVLCQTLKVVITGARTHDWNIRHWFDAGGMPSSHSSSVVAVTTAAGLREGFSSTLFAICFVMAFIVMYDAAGVRRETGKQGKIINEILRWPITITENDESTPDELKEKVGHSPLEVMVGAAIGIACAFILQVFY